VNQPPVWTPGQLESERTASEEHFREHRHTEPLELYLELFDQYQSVVEEVMEETVDLTKLEDRALDMMSDERTREVFRYLTGPPVSEDDFKVLMKAKSLAPVRLKEDPALLARLVTFMRDWHDRRRFPWVSDGWKPKEHDLNAAVLATTALLAMRRVETLRRHQGKTLQEERVELQLVRTGHKKVNTRRIRTVGDAPSPGEFCRESHLGTRKADFVIGLWDGRTLALECKVSNSSTNSVKRLNNDAAVKAEVWRKDFGTSQIVPSAVLSGVYAVTNLTDAQRRGLTLFWAHNLRAMTDWIASTKKR
jgi:hypothetical protein